MPNQFTKAAETGEDKPAGANQYTKAAETGADKPEGANQFTTGKRQKLDQATKDRIRAEKAANGLEKILDDPEATIEQKTAAAKALLPYGKSTYASVTAQEEHEWEGMTESEAEDIVRALILANPSLIQRLGIGLRPVQEPSGSVVSEQQSQCSMGNAA